MIINEKEESKTVAKSVNTISETPKKEILKSDKPIGNKSISEFSIKKYLEKKEEEGQDLFSQVEEDLSEHHFSETDLQTEWALFLKEISREDSVIYNAIKSFQLHKISENQIEVVYSSDSAKQEFERIQANFFNHFKRKVNNYKIEVVYRADVSLRREVLTKRKIFDKFAEINPALKDLEDLMKFDFS